MSSDFRSPAQNAPKSPWRRFLAWIEAMEDAMDVSYDDVQDRRILALENEVARLRTNFALDQAADDLIEIKKKS